MCIFYISYVDRKTFVCLKVESSELLILFAFYALIMVMMMCLYYVLTVCMDYLCQGLKNKASYFTPAVVETNETNLTLILSFGIER